MVLVVARGEPPALSQFVEQLFLLFLALAVYPGASQQVAQFSINAKLVPLLIDYKSSTAACSRDGWCYPADSTVLSLPPSSCLSTVSPWCSGALEEQDETIAIAQPGTNQ